MFAKNIENYFKLQYNNIITYIEGRRYNLNKLEIHNNRTFEDIKHIDENGVEFWLARELMQELEYTKWGNFKNVINKAIEACKNSNITISDHFADVGKLVKERATT